MSSVVMLSALLGEVSNLYTKRQVELKRMQLLLCRLDPAILFSFDQEGDGVDKVTPGAPSNRQLCNAHVTPT